MLLSCIILYTTVVQDANKGNNNLLILITFTLAR
jgi:hypothetical protein